MPEAYVEQRAGGYYVAGTRISLDSVVYAFLRGEPAEGIADSLPALSLEQVYGALAFDRCRAESRRIHPALYAKLDAARGARQAGAPETNED